MEQPGLVDIQFLKTRSLIDSRDKNPMIEHTESPVMMWVTIEVFLPDAGKCNFSTDL